MKLFVCIFLCLVGAAVGIEVIFSPDTYTVVEGGSYSVRLEILNGFVDEQMTFEVTATYDFGNNAFYNIASCVGHLSNFFPPKSDFYRV